MSQLKNKFVKALTLYKYLLFTSSIAYWLYILYDDLHFVEQYWDTGQWDHLIVIWGGWFFGLLALISFYYWFFGSVAILIWHWVERFFNLKNINF